MIDILADANATIVMTEEVFTQQTELLKATYKPLQAGLGCLGAAIGVGLVGMKAAEAVGRNPDASTPILVQAIIGMALAEAVACYSLFL